MHLALKRIAWSEMLGLGDRELGMPSARHMYGHVDGIPEAGEDRRPSSAMKAARWYHRSTLLFFPFWYCKYDFRFLLAFTSGGCILWKEERTAIIWLHCVNRSHRLHRPFSKCRKVNCHPKAKRHQRDNCCSRSWCNDWSPFPKVLTQQFSVNSKLNRALLPLYLGQGLLAMEFTGAVSPYKNLSILGRNTVHNKKSVPESIFPTSSCIKAHKKQKFCSESYEEDRECEWCLRATRGSNPPCTQDARPPRFPPFKSWFGLVDRRQPWFLLTSGRIIRTLKVGSGPSHQSWALILPDFLFPCVV